MGEVTRPETEEPLLPGEQPDFPQVDNPAPEEDFVTPREVTDHGSRTKAISDSLDRKRDEQMDANEQALEEVELDQEHLDDVDDDEFEDDDQV